MPYPAGHIVYSFKMYAGCDRTLSCPIGDPRVREVIFEKAKTDDQYDAEWHMTIHFGSIFSPEDVQSLGDEIKDDILDLLSLTFNIAISEVRMIAYGLTPRVGEGAVFLGALPSLEGRMYCRVGVRKLSSNDMKELQTVLSKLSYTRKDYLTRLFRHALSVDDPVVQFMILYLILYEMYRSQPAIDEFIMKAAPFTSQSLSPHTRDLETTYTRLRNELTHRAAVSPNDTRVEIINHLDEFRMIVQEVVRAKRLGKRDVAEQIDSKNTDSSR
jgi:hypothetical protein